MSLQTSLNAATLGRLEFVCLCELIVVSEHLNWFFLLLIIRRLRRPSLLQDKDLQLATIGIQVTI